MVRRMQLAGFFGVVGCMQVMPMGGVGVVGGGFMILVFVVFRGEAVVPGGVLVMLGGLLMMLRQLG